ncbi:MAG TPA: PfkB family carbohydrate kinase [Solirubrobacteraceae bacterium]|nr:PfkB family carbohydrate kinase [Solirubrobacteraceae bacterium]
MIVCVAGNPSVDKLFEVEELVHGEIHRPSAFLSLPGGKGIHVAQVATVLGAEALATGILAGHTGRWVAETLAAEGVPSEFVWGEGETRSSLSVADRATGRLTEFYEDGVPPRPEEWSELVRVVEGLMGRASWLALAGSPPGVDGEGEGYSRLIAVAHSAGVPVAVDSRGAALAQAIDSAPELVKINVHEAQGLLGRAIEDIEQARAAAVEIRSRVGGEGHACVVTLGERGMVLVDPAGEAWRGAVAVRGSYPVGSGDAFLAGLLTALSGGASWSQAAALALGAAAANAEVPGAARLEPGRARELAGRAEIHSLAAEA